MFSADFISGSCDFTQNFAYYYYDYYYYYYFIFIIIVILYKLSVAVYWA